MFTAYLRFLAAIRCSPSWLQGKEKEETSLPILLCSIRLASNVTSFRTIRVFVRAAGQPRTCPLCQRDRTPVLPLPDLAFVYDSVCLVGQSITLFRVIKLLQTTAPDVKV